MSQGNRSLRLAKQRPAAAGDKRLDTGPEQMPNMIAQTHSGALVMLTRRIDAALEALWTCRERLPLLRDLFQPGSRERAAIDAVIAAIADADAALGAAAGGEPAQR